jgi:hypothetical protein
LKRILIVPFAAVLCLAAVFAACGDDDDKKTATPSSSSTATPTASADTSAQKQEIADFILKMTTTNGSTATNDEVDYYTSHITDSFTQAFGGTTVADCRAHSQDCIGDPLTDPQVDPAKIKITGNTATASVETDEVGTFTLDIAIADNDYKLTGIHPTDDDVPSGATKVDLGLQEFEFAFDPESAAVKSGNFYFAAKNTGQQAHEIGLAKIPEDADVQTLLESDDPTSLGVEFRSFKLPYSKGDAADFYPGELEAGRYLLVCFFTNTDEGYEGTPHAFLGMAQDFTVEGEGGTGGSATPTPTP